MKILFGIQGTGNGHISRARIMATELEKYKNVKVQYLFSGREKEQLFDMEAFGHYWHRAGLTFITSNGQVDHMKTALKNNIFKFFYDIISLDLSEFDLIITDFEPIVAWAGKLKGKPVLGIGHQYAFGENTPLTGDTAFTRTLMKYFAPVKVGLGLHWHNYNENVLPPIIDTELTLKTKESKFIVYLPFENQQFITQILQQFPDKKFVQYAPTLSDQEIGNVSVRKTSLAFKNDLKSASGVICNSGFELISECLHLGLPILTKPLNGQMEQYSNALALQELNYATVVETLSKENLSHWFESKKTPKPRPLPNVAKAITELIVSGKWQEYHALNKRLWENTLVE